MQRLVNLIVLEANFTSELERNLFCAVCIGEHTAIKTDSQLGQFNVKWN
jgi:hypothetical protein